MTEMISPRAPRDGDRSRKALLPGSCGAIGAQLAAVRDTRQLSVEEVASTLLLSKGQVIGLEQGDPSPFYNPDYYLRGLRKYMALLGLAADLLVEDDDAAEESGLRLMLAEMAPRRAARGGHRSLRTVTVATVLLAAAGGTYYMTRNPSAALIPTADEVVSLGGTSPLPAQPLQAPAEAPSPVRAEPASITTAGSDPGATVRVSVGKSTWIFVRYPDNRVVERRLEAGEEIEVGPLPVYLAVGTADSVEVRVENRPVALGPYIRNGQVRLTQPDLAKLVP